MTLTLCCHERVHLCAVYSVYYYQAPHSHVTCTGCQHVPCVYINDNPVMTLDLLERLYCADVVSGR